LSLPAPTSDNSKPGDMLLTKHHPQSIFPESYRSIRTSLLFSRPERPPQVILLTSASPGEGKTGTSVNLGIALAQDGHRVLIIDADLRKGCCHDRLGMANHKGLSNILTGQLAIEDGIQATPIPGLSLLTCGVCPPSPADLLGSNKMKEVLTKLRDSFQFIIIDTPPAIALADAPILSVISDGVILVFHGRKTTAASARQLIARLDGINAPILGVILNSVDLQNPEFSYYGHYRSYYPEPDQTGSQTKNGKRSVNSVEATLANGVFSLLAKLDRNLRPVDRQVTAPTGGDYNLVANDDGANLKTEDTNPTAASGRTSTTPNGRNGEARVAAKSGSEIVPRESLDQLVESLEKSLGPSAALIVREQIVNLGESYLAFPKQRMEELLKLIQRKISQRGVTFS
jgi:capsular exopolysaccharide synthesis family protein